MGGAAAQLVFFTHWHLNKVVDMLLLSLLTCHSCVGTASALLGNPARTAFRPGPVCLRQLPLLPDCHLLTAPFSSL